MQTLLLGPEVVDETARLPAVIDAVAAAFAAKARGTTRMPAKSYIDLPASTGDFRSMPAYVSVQAADNPVADESWEAAAVKWVNAHPDNPADHDLPTVMGSVIYSDPETAFPLALLDGTILTRRRTGAAAAIATDHLAREDATSMGLVGAGVQSYTQLEAVSLVRDIEEVVVTDRTQSAMDAFVDHFEDRFAVRAGSIGEATRCDVLSTVTPVEEPVVDTVAEGTHVNAVGADAAGKHEIADALLREATIVIDDHEQCTHSGEINVPWSEGVLDDAALHGEVGDVIVGSLPGRTARGEITLFDSTGLAIQDVAAARVAYQRARDADRGQPVSLVGTD